MRKRILGYAAAGVAATLVLGACSSSVGGDTTSSTASSSVGGTSSGSSSSSSSASESAAGGPIAKTINIGLEQTPGGYNCNTAAANSVYCAYVDNVTQGALVIVQPDGSLKPNTEFGTYKKTSDDPLTVEITIADGAVWSDGVPIDFDDVLLQWAALSGTHPGGNDADGNPVDLFAGASTNGFAELKMPEGKAGDKTYTWVFNTPYVDWEALVGTTFIPAHIVAEQAGLSSADNGAELIKAIQDNDTAKLTKVGAFWSTGFDYEVDLPTLPDTAILPSSGPYKVDNASGSNLTVVRNDAYWGTPAVTDSLVFKLVNDQEWVQAMANGEIDAFDPSNPSGDTIAQLDAAKDSITYQAGESYTFSHVDFNSGPGGAMENPAVREAFEMCVPREQLVEKYAKPVFDGAQVLNLREFLPAQGNYKEILAQVPSATKYASVDLAGAKAKLVAAGVTVPYDVQFTFAASSSLRADQVQVIKASCDQAGFNIIAKPDADVFTTLALKDTSWGLAVFGWAGSGLVASGQSIYVTDGEQNFGRYSSKIVDDAWAKIVTSTDRAAAEKEKIPMEEELWANPYNAVLYANPGIAAFSSKVTGPKFNPTQTGVTWNAATWSKTE
ncbi:MAG: ABC transporter substrate-binding protein [Nakamurella sp.]